MLLWQRLLAQGAPAPVGQVLLTTPGSGTWTVPAGVTSICVAMAGPGGPGSSAAGGGGGALTYANNIAVTPGQVVSYNIGQKSSSDTWFISSSSVVAGRGGKGDAPEYGYGGVSSGSLRSGGGNGGAAGGSSGGGGAGGYSANGTNGVSGGNSSAPATGGAASGGDQDFGGGGVGLIGQGSSATGSGAYSPGKCGSDGANGSGSSGGNYGGGAADNSPGVGGIRIIWGASRAYPSTNTRDM